MVDQVFKRLDDASGESDEFYFKDNKSLVGKFVITGEAGANIKIFEAREERGKNTLFKASCTDWNSATATLHIKTSHVDDDFSETAVIFSENSAIYSDVR